MSGSTGPNSSPIHEFVPVDNSLFNLGDKVRVGDIVHLAHRTLVRRLPQPDLQETSTKPSSHPQPKRYKSSQFESPASFLTKEVLEARVIINEHLFIALGVLKTSHRIRKYDEQSVTKDAVKPIMAVLLATFEARIPDDDRQWAAADCVKLENTIELDIVMMREGGASLPDGVAPELEGLESAIEMKSPRSCNLSDIVSFTSRFMNAIVTQQIRDQVGKQGSLLKKVHPEQPFVIHGLSLAPAHLFPTASNGGNTLAIGSDMLALDGEYPSIVTNPKNWLEYIDKLGAFVLAIMCHNDTRISEAWYEDFPGQRQQVQSLISAAGKALQPTPAEVVLTFFWAAIWVIQQTVSLPLLLVLIHLRWLDLTKTLKERNVGRIALDSSSPWRFPLGLALFPPRSTHETAENIVYVYSHPKIVIKLFSNEKTYANERTCYERLIDLQGRGVPVVHAMGVCPGDGRPFLILSHEGEKLEKMSDADKATLQPVVTAIHGQGLHHHDLHPRNVVRDSKGKLTIIDFGYAGPCTSAECTDDWKEWWAS